MGSPPALAGTVPAHSTPGFRHRIPHPSSGLHPSDDTQAGLERPALNSENADFRRDSALTRKGKLKQGGRHATAPAKARRRTGAAAEAHPECREELRRPNAPTGLLRAGPAQPRPLCATTPLRVLEPAPATPPPVCRGRRSHAPSCVPGRGRSQPRPRVLEPAPATPSPVCRGGAGSSHAPSRVPGAVPGAGPRARAQVRALRACAVSPLRPARCAPPPARPPPPR